MALNSKILFHVFWLTLLLAPFQNCSKINFNSNSKPSTTKKAPPLQGNGTGYGGKVYISKLYSNGQCSDGTQVYGRFVLNDQTSANLDRFNCADMTPVLIDLTDPEVSNHYSELEVNPFDIIVYDKKIFETTPPVLPLRITEVLYVCTGPGDIKVVLKEGVDSVTYQLFYLATITQNSSELFVEMSRDINAKAGKSFYGSSGSATYTLDTIYGASPHAGTVSYTAPGINLNSNLSCYPAF